MMSPFSCCMLHNQGIHVLDSQKKKKRKGIHVLASSHPIFQPWSSTKLIPYLSSHWLYKVSYIGGLIERLTNTFGHQLLHTTLFWF